MSSMVSRNLRILVGLSLTLALLASLSACGAPSGDTRPSDSNLVTGINLLVSSFDANHPSLVTWKTDAVKVQLAHKLPLGINTEAGWFLRWPNPKDGELSQVIVPWTLLGQYPNSPHPYFNRPEAGNLIPQSTSADLVKEITKVEMMGDQYFGAVVDIRASAIDPQWIIFTTVPYLPVTDNAYGFATVKDKQWSIVDFGTALVGCRIVPAKVESEFGYSCPTSP